MSLGTLLYIVVIIIVVIANIYKGIKKAKEEQQKRQQENANRPQPNPYSQPQPEPTSPRKEPIPDPWTERKPAPAQRKADTSGPKPVAKTQQVPKRQKSIEEVLEEMMRQYDTPQPQKTADKYSRIDSPVSVLDRPTTEVSKNYKFDESMVASAFTDRDYKNILEEEDTLDAAPSHQYQEFNPREAFKYATLLERKYQ